MRRTKDEAKLPQRMQMRSGRRTVRSRRRGAGSFNAPLFKGVLSFR